MRTTTIPAARLLSLAKEARAEADRHELDVIRDRLIRVANGLAKGYTRIAGDSRNADPKALHRAIVDASAIIAEAIMIRTNWEEQL